MVRQLALNNLVLLMQYGVGGLVPLVLVPHIVREIGLAGFGSLAIALACASYGSVVVQYGFHLSGPHQLARLAPHETALDVVGRIASAKLVLLVIVLGAVLFGVPVADALGYPVSGVQMALLLAIPLATALHSGWHLQSAGRFGTLAVLSISGAALSLAIGWAWVDGPAAVPAAALALAIGPLWSGAATGVASWRLAAAPRGSLRKRPFWQPTEELRQGWPLFASQITSALYTASGPLVVGLLAGKEQAGAYGAVERIVNPLIALCLLTHTAAYPRLAVLYRSDHPTYLRLMRIVLLTYLGVASGLALVASLAWHPLLQFVFGAAGADQEALLGSALVWMLLGIFATALTGYLTVSGQGAAVLPLTFRVLGLSLLIGLPAVRAWGAWAWMASLCVAQTLVLFLGWRTWKAEARRPSPLIA